MIGERRVRGVLDARISPLAGASFGLGTVFEELLGRVAQVPSVDEILVIGAIETVPSSIAGRAVLRLEQARTDAAAILEGAVEGLADHDLIALFDIRAPLVMPDLAEGAALRLATSPADMILPRQLNAVPLGASAAALTVRAARVLAPRIGTAGSETALEALLGTHRQGLEVLHQPAPQEAHRPDLSLLAPTAEHLDRIQGLRTHLDAVTPAAQYRALLSIVGRTPAGPGAWFAPPPPGQNVVTPGFAGDAEARFPATIRLIEPTALDAGFRHRLAEEVRRWPHAVLVQGCAMDSDPQRWFDTLVLDESGRVVDPASFTPLLPQAQEDHAAAWVGEAFHRARIEALNRLSEAPALF